MHPEDFLSLEEWHSLLKAAQSPRETALLWLMAGCGLRVSEAAVLKVEHLDSAGRYLHFVNGKSSKQRTSILPKPALEALSAHLQGRNGGYHLRGQRFGTYLYQTDPEATRRSCGESRTSGNEEGQSKAAKEDHTASAEAQLQ